MTKLQQEQERLGFIQEQVRAKFNPGYPENATPKCKFLPGETLEGWCKRQINIDMAEDRRVFRKKWYRNNS